MCSEGDGTLLDKTRAMLATAEQSYLDIYKATGLSPNWLSFVATGKIKDPSVNKVQKLYEHLRGSALSL